MSFMRNRLAYFEGTRKCCQTYMGKKGWTNVVCCDCEKRITGNDCILNAYITLILLNF